MSKKLKITLAIGGVLLLLLLAVYLQKTDSQTAAQPNAIESIEEDIADKTFKTKTEAYDALANQKETFYNRPVSAFQATESAPKPVAVAAVPTHTAPTAEKDTKFDAAYQEVEQNLRGIYDNPPDNTQPVAAKPSSTAGSASKPQAAESPEERRREAMRQDWGMNNNDHADPAVSQASMFRAVIHGTQSVKVGQTALFRTKEPIKYGNLVVPANTLLSGAAMISSNRLTIKISYVRINNEVFTLPLEVYGSDGIPGIPLNYDEAGQIADRQLSSTVIQEGSSAISQYGGAIGRIAGSLISGAGSQVKSAKNMEVTLIDNQSIILKIIVQ